jgi:hypothetical protein
MRRYEKTEAGSTKKVDEELEHRDQALTHRILACVQTLLHFYIMPLMRMAIVPFREAM